MKKLIILAPAGNIAAARIALFSGADAIYTGVKGWSLRPNRFEVTEEELKKIVTIVRENKAQIFLAMNCFYSSSEIPKVLMKIKEYCSLGIDAVILSDIGLMKEVKISFKNLAIYVSVQASASSSLDIKFYRKLGVSGVTLPRDFIDLSPENLRAFKDLGVNLGVFIIGDDTTNYDGRCYLSSYLNQKAIRDSTERERVFIGNSNRSGKCFQMCKKNCFLFEKGSLMERGFLLRRGDLTHYRKAKELVELGVTIFKVQGREFPSFLMSRLIRNIRGLVDNLEDSKKVQQYCKRLDELVILKQMIQVNHRWLLAKRESRFWSNTKRYVEYSIFIFWMQKQFFKKIFSQVFKWRSDCQQRVLFWE